jgi:hypothetical protein
MAFHVPFEQRKRRDDNAVYIGFEDRRQQYRNQRIYRRTSGVNGFGLAGFIMSILSIFSMGFTAPIALLLSVIGLRKSPRGFATAGTIISLLALLPIGLITIGGIYAHRTHQVHRIERQQHHQFVKAVEKTKSSLTDAAGLIREYRSENSGYLPEGIEGNKMLIKADSKDAWGEALRYEVEQLSDSPATTIATIRSAGRDKEFDTADDVVTQIPSGIKTISDRDSSEN